jgi:putative PIG3 family NAD(P)H quinone oxidoreductase
MFAIEIAQPGGPEVLQPCRRPAPAPEPGEVLIKVAAAGINRPDVLQRRGLYPPPPGASDIPGLEVAGRVVALGEGARNLAVGEEVCALVTGGGYAEYCVAAAALCLPIPRGWNCIEAAGLPEALFTVWANVFEQAGLKAGERFLVHGGSGGIGTTAIQLAREFGAEVFATVGTVEKCVFCEQLGAKAIDYNREDFAGRILEYTGGRGVDVILDSVGGPYLQRNFASLAPGGRLALIGLQGGAKAEASLAPVLLKHLTLAGSTLRPRSVAEKAAIAAALKARVWPLLKAGRIKPVIHAVFPLGEAAEAHCMLESGRPIGKLVLEVG